MNAGQTFQRVARFVLFSLLVAGALPAGAQAGEKWRLVQSAGQVTAGGTGLVPVAVRSNEALPKDGWLETGPNGRAVLAHGRDTIIVGPLSRVQLPDDRKDGNTQVIQSLGSALYQIGKEAAPHFQVDTPYLAAIVKGTTFVVSVGSDSARVDVTEGLVEVASPDGSSVEYIRAGLAGLVARADGASERVHVVGSLESREGLPPAAPDLLEQAEERGEREASVSHEPSKVVVANAIGDVDLNIRAVSTGLASGVIEAAVVSAAARVEERDGEKSKDGKVSKDSRDGAISELALTVEAEGSEAGGTVPGSAAPSLAAPGDTSALPSEGSPGGSSGVGGGGGAGGISSPAVPSIADGASPPGAGSGGGGMPATSPALPPGAAPDLGGGPPASLPVVPGGGGAGAPAGNGGGAGAGHGAGSGPVLPPRGGGG